MFNRTPKLNWAKTILWVLLVGLAIGATIAPVPTFAEASNAAVEIGYDVGQKAPDFTLPQLEDGTPFTLHEQVESYDVTVLYFFFAAT